MSPRRAGIGDAQQLLAEARAELERGGSFGGDLLAVVFRLGSGEDVLGAVGKAKLGVALLFDVHAIDEARELGQRIQGDDDVLVHLEGVGAAGDGAELLAVGPEALGLGGVAGDEDQRVGMLLEQGADAFHAALGLLGGVAGNVDQQRGLGGFGARSFHLVVDGANVLVVEVLQRQQCLGAVGGQGEDARELEDDAAGLVEIRAEELQAEGLLGFVLGIEDEDAPR